MAQAALRPITNRDRAKRSPKKGITVALTSEAALTEECRLLAEHGNTVALAGLYDAFIAAATVLQAIAEQPRLRDEQVGYVLDGEFERLHDKARIVARHLTSMLTNEKTNKEERARVLVDWSFRSGRCLGDAVRTLAQILVD